MVLSLLKAFLTIGYVLYPELENKLQKPPLNNLQVTPALAKAQKKETSPSKNTPPPASPVPENLNEELAKLKAKEQEILQKEADLKVLEQRVEAKLQELKKLEANINQMLEEAKVLKDKKIKHLVDVYANMNPKQAAQVLETLEEDLAVKILAGMNGRKAGEILSYVNAKKAASLSEKLTRLQTPFGQ